MSEEKIVQGLTLGVLAVMVVWGIPTALVGALGWFGTIIVVLAVVAVWALIIAEERWS